MQVLGNKRVEERVACKQITLDFVCTIKLLTRYGMPYILSTWIGPKVHAVAMSEASMMHQQVVERMTSPLSLGVNRSLLGRKCDPFLPGLLYHCSTQHAYIYISASYLSLLSSDEQIYA
jgi:hypothetical protein